MAELEIHHEEGSEHDPMGQRVGVMAALLAVFLAVVTIASHRTHTEAIIKKTESNDQWGYYQASRMKYHNLELGERLIGVLGPNNPGAQDTLKQFAKDKQKYTEQSKDLQEKAQAKTEESEAAEHRALRYDLGEGLLEIALVLSSLYFIARKMLFPVAGLIAGVAGLIVAITGLFV
jgi:cell division protein FtsN